MASSLHFKTSQATAVVAVHPVVILAALDHFIRRSDGQRVIGTLLGNSNSEGQVEIKSAFAVPYTEGENVAVGDLDFHTSMLDLHHRVSPKEGIVGWYSAGDESDFENSVVIHEFYAKKMTNSPIHLTIDTNLTNLSLSVKAFTNVPLTINEKALGTQFLPVPVEIQALDMTEKIGVDALMKNKNNGNPISSDLENLESSVKKLDALIDSVSAYVNKVVEKKTSGDANVGRFLATALSALPKLDSSELEQVFNNSVQDLLLVVYLANLTRTQLQLSEKLQRVV